MEIMFENYPRLKVCPTNAFQVYVTDFHCFDKKNSQK